MKVCPLLLQSTMVLSVHIPENKIAEASDPFVTMTSCIEGECAWYCEWSKSCAMVTIPAEISDRLVELRQAVTK